MSATNGRRSLAIHATALVAGTIFGMGLAISGMIHPSKVKHFLDVSLIMTGGWDPSLAFVLAAAVIVTMGAVRIGHRRRKPLLAQSFLQPHSRRVDGELALGAAVFGIGWGMAGLCPGPAVADLVSAFPDILYFLAAMMFGMALVHLWRRRAGRPAPAASPVGEPHLPEPRS